MVPQRKSKLTLLACLTFDMCHSKTVEHAVYLVIGSGSVGTAPADSTRPPATIYAVIRKRAAPDRRR
jgi:hypothetical protein